VVARVRDGCDFRARAAVIYRLRGRTCDRAVLAGCVGKGVAGNGERGRDRDIGRDIGVGPSGGQDAVGPGDEVIAGIRDCRSLGARAALAGAEGTDLTGLPEASRLSGNNRQD